MRIIALRHGYAGVRDPNAYPDDSERPLTKKGGRKLVKAAKGMPHVAKPDKVFASPSTRTWQTAAIMREHAGWPAAKKADWLNDGVPPKDALKAIRRAHKNGVGTLALVGHEPNLGALLSFLMAGDARDSDIHLKKGGVALLDFDGAPGNAALQGVLTRKEIVARGKG